MNERRWEANAKDKREFDEAISELVDSIVEGTEENYQNKLESFESHVNKIRLELQERMDTFRNSFLEGYRILIEELSHSHYEGAAAEENLPPNAIRL